MTYTWFLASAFSAGIMLGLMIAYVIVWSLDR